MATGCEPHTHLARLFGRTTLPLTLAAQRTGATTAHAGRMHHTQASIGFSASFMREQFLSSRATKRAIRLERKVGSGEAPRFPGSGSGKWTVSRGRSG